jgi:hypothetical protein
MAFADSSGERIEHGEEDSRVWKPDEAVDREAGERDHALDAVLRESDLGDLARHRVGSVEGRPRRQLHDPDQVVLVMRRHEAGRNGGEAEPSRADEAAVQHDDYPPDPERSPGKNAVAARGRIEPFVEEPEEPSEGTVEDAGQPIPLSVMRSQEQRGQCRA